MSREKVRTSLEGYEGPFFPKYLDKLDTLFEATAASDLVLFTIARGIETKGLINILQSFEATTSDSYHWFLVLRFKISSGEVAVLFPYKKSYEKGKPALDRSIAIYTKGKKIPAEIEIILKGIQCGLFKIRHEELMRQLKKTTEQLIEATEKINQIHAEGVNLSGLVS